MSSGWGTGVATGLLEGVNSNIEQQRKLANEQSMLGMDAQLRQFQEASKEYDNEKREVKQRTDRIQANASLISGGAPDENSLALAYRFDQATQGKRDLEKDELDKSQRDYKYMNDTPSSVKNVSNQTQSNNSAEVPSYITTQVMQRFGINQDQINSVYTRPTVQNPSNVQAGGVPISQVDQQRIQEKLSAESSPAAMEAIKAKAMATQQGQVQAQGYSMGQNGEMTPMNGATQQAPQAPAPQMPPPQPVQPQAQAPQGQSSLAVPASALQPPSASAQPQSQGQPSPPSPMQLPQAQPAQNQAQPQQQDNKSTVDYLSSIIKDGKEPVSASQVNDNFLKPDGAWDTRNYDALKRLTPDDARLVKAISNGDGTFTPYMMTRGNAVTQHVMKVLRDFDNTANEEREKNKYAFSQGPQEAATINRLNTALGHMGLLNEAGKAVAQNDVQALNKIATVYGVQTGNDAQTTYNTISNAVANELRAVYGGKNSGLQELEQQASNLNINQSPAQRAGVLKTMSNMLTSKIDAYDTQMKGIMGNAYNPNHTFLAPHAAQVYKELSSMPTQAKDPASLPVFNDPNSDEFKSLQSGSQFMVPGETVPRYKH